MLLTIALLAPALLLAGLLLWNVDRQARSALQHQLTETARALSLVVDREIGQQAALLQALSTAPSLNAGDWRAFDAQAREAVTQPDVWVVVSDGAGRQLVNTRLAAGATLPSAALPKSLTWAGRRGHGVTVSNMFRGAAADAPVVVVRQDVRLGDGREVQLYVGMLVSHFDQVFKDQKLPQTWRGVLLDASGSLIARNLDSAKMVGRKVSPAMARALRDSPTGVIKSQTAEGVKIYSAYSRLPDYGWAVAVGVPRGEMAGAAKDILQWAAIIGVLLIGAGITAGRAMARSIAGPVEGLAEAARASSEGRLVSIPATGMAEVDDLATALTEANRTLVAREAQLRESEERFRLVAEDAPVMLWMGDEVGACLYLNKALREFWGVSDDFAAFSWKDTLLEEDWEPLFASFGKAMAAQEAFEVEARYNRADGVVRTLFTRAVPRRDAEGRFVGMIGVNVDVTDARRAETHQQLLINELNHRVKNTLATVQSIAHQTLKEGEITRDARDLLTARLLALSAAHNVLTRESWEGAELAEVVAEAVRPYDGVSEPRITMEGPAVRVGPRVALALSMALHELATNAAKYGALSGDAGKVEVRWRLGERLEIEWRERGGPPVVAPSRKGFGSRLLRQGLAAELGASADLAYEPDGLVCVISAPLQGRGE